MEPNCRVLLPLAPSSSSDMLFTLRPVFLSAVAQQTVGSEQDESRLTDLRISGGCGSRESFRFRRSRQAAGQLPAFRGILRLAQDWPAGATLVSQVRSKPGHEDFPRRENGTGKRLQGPPLVRAGT